MSYIPSREHLNGPTVYNPEHLPHFDAAVDALPQSVLNTHATHGGLDFQGDHPTMSKAKRAWAFRCLGCGDSVFAMRA